MVGILIMETENHRKYLKKLMQENNLSVNSWSKIAGISEGTLRAYLSGRTNSISIKTLAKLAEAIQITVDELLLIETKPIRSYLDEEVFENSVLEVDNLIIQKKLKFDSKKKAKLYLLWYELKSQNIAKDELLRLIELLK